MYANISFVDFVGLAIGLTLDTATGRQTVGGLVPTGLATIAAGLRTEATIDNSGWRELIVPRSGTVLRVLSPNLAALYPGWSGTLNGYLDPYITRRPGRNRRPPTCGSTPNRLGARSSAGSAPTDR